MVIATHGRHERDKASQNVADICGLQCAWCDGECVLYGLCLLAYFLFSWRCSVHQSTRAIVGKVMKGHTWQNPGSLSGTRWARLRSVNIFFLLGLRCSHVAPRLGGVINLFQLLGNPLQLQLSDKTVERSISSDLEASGVSFAGEEAWSCNVKISIFRDSGGFIINKAFKRVLN